jgi:hypothetical protein
MFSPQFFKEGLTNVRSDICEVDNSDNRNLVPQLARSTYVFVYQAPFVADLIAMTVLLDAWTACQGAEVLLESPSAMAGVHIAEALGIPYFRTFTMPWTK